MLLIKRDGRLQSVRDMGFQPMRAIITFGLRASSNIQARSEAIFTSELRQRKSLDAASGGLGLCGILRFLCQPDSWHGLEAHVTETLPCALSRSHSEAGALAGRFPHVSRGSQRARRIRFTKGNAPTATIANPPGSGAGTTCDRARSSAAKSSPTAR